MVYPHLERVEKAMNKNTRYGYAFCMDCGRIFDVSTCPYWPWTKAENMTIKQCVESLPEDRYPKAHKLEILRLEVKALRAFAQSAKQKAILKQIEALRSKP